MSISRGAPRLLLALSLVLLLGFCHTVFAGWQDEYKEGKKAYEEGRHRKAVRHFLAALEKKDKEKANAIKASGMFFEPYLPHFYLGMTLFQLKEYDQALAELETSESMGVVQKDDALMSLLNQTKAAARTLARAAEAQEQPPTPTATPPVARRGPGASTPEGAGPGASGAAKAGSKTGAPPRTKADSEAAGGGAAPGRPETTPKPDSGSTVTKAEPLKPPSKPPAAAGPDPALIRAVDAAAADIADAQRFAAEAGDLLQGAERSRLDAAARDVREAGTAQEAESRHRALKTLLAGLRNTVDGRRRDGAAAEALAAARQGAGGTLQSAESFLSQSRGELKASERRRLTQEISALKSAGTAEAVRNAAATLGDDVNGLRNLLRQRAAAPQEQPGAGKAAAVAAARRAYAGAVEAYFKGETDRALSGLEEAGDTIENDPDLHAMLGSALYKKYLLTRSEDPSLKARAEEAFRTALGIKSDYTLDARYFPPKVISFFKEVAAGQSGPSGQ